MDLIPVARALVRDLRDLMRSHQVHSTAAQADGNCGTKEAKAEAEAVLPPRAEPKALSSQARGRFLAGQRRQSRSVSKHPAGLFSVTRSVTHQGNPWQTIAHPKNSRPPNGLSGPRHILTGTSLRSPAAL